MVACDVYRPAAIDQLGVIGDQIGVPVYKEVENKNPVEIALKFYRFMPKTTASTIIIVDTAGRLSVDEEMMNEISQHQGGHSTQ